MIYVKEAFDTNWVAPLGKNVDMLEKEVASYVNRKHAAALISARRPYILGLNGWALRKAILFFAHL